MSNNLQDKGSDEIDLGQIFNGVGRLFEKLFKFIASFFTAIFSFIIFFLRVVIDHLIIVGVVVGLAFVVGFFIERNRPTVYEASMLVRPHFESKYQLVTNVHYFNSLLKEKNLIVLSETFEINENEAEKLLAFEVDSGPETKNELLRQYDVYLKSLDSSRAQSITYIDFVENRDIYSSELFLITVTAFQKDIFRKLESGFDSTFSNRYSIEQKEIRDKTLDIKRAVYLKDLARMDTLQAVYLDIKKKEAERGSASLNLQGILPLQQEKAKTYEYELFQYEIRTRDSIRKVEQLKIEEDNYYDVLSRFPEVGNESNTVLSKYWISLPLISFVLLCILFVIIRSFKFIKNYER